MQLDFEKFEADMAVFSFRQHQDFLTYLNLLNDLGYTINNAEAYVKYMREERTKQNEKSVNILKGCPECSAIMFAYAINTEAGNQTDNPEENSVWLCPSSHCRHTIYNKETVNQLREV